MTVSIEETRRPYKSWPNDAGFDASIEQRTPIPLKVTGTIPSFAAGTLYRTGPGHHKENTVSGEFRVSHWFDGFTHVHRFQLISTPSGCTVLYNSRRQVDDLLEIVRKTGKLDGISFGQKREPCTSFFAKLKSVFEPQRSGNPQLENVGVTIALNAPGLSSSSEKRRNVLTTFTDTSATKHLDPTTLKPIGVASQTILHPALKGQLSAAHAAQCPLTGDTYNYNLAFGVAVTYRIFHTSASTHETSILATISGTDIKPAYVHSLFLTASFVILAIWPSYIAAGGAKILWERNLLDAIASFDPTNPIVWLVIDRHHGRGLVSKFTSPAAFAFHSINAFEEPSLDAATTEVFCDVVQYHNLDILHKTYYDNLKSTGPGVADFIATHREGIKTHFARYRLSVPSTPSKKSRPTEIAKTYPLIGELPTINPSFATKRTRFTYGVVDRGLSSFVDGIAKTDMETGENWIWEKMGHTPGEPIFVAGVEDEGEDGGVVLSVVLDGVKGTSYLLCLNARNMVELGRAEVLVAVGLGFHGRHIAA
jgi:torulene dioxygenase